MKERSKRIVDIFNGVNSDTMDLLNSFYDPEVRFVDPLGEIQGRDGMRAHYENLYRTVQSIHFDFTDEVVSGDTHVVMWTLHLSAVGLNDGNPVIMDGNSVLQFGVDDLVVYHRDYFDMGALIYRHIPLLKCFIKRLHNRMKH